MNPQVELSSVKKMSAVERSEAQLRVAMKSPEHLGRWLEESGRRWIVFDGRDLVKALPWPDGIEALMHVIAVYRDHRSVIQTGRTRIEKVYGKDVEVPVFKDETLEIEELDRCIRYLINRASQVDAGWKLENPAL